MSKRIYILLVAVLSLLICFLIFSMRSLFFEEAGCSTEIEEIYILLEEPEEETPLVEHDTVIVEELESVPEEMEWNSTTISPFTDDGLLQYSEDAFYNIFFFNRDIWYYNGESDRMPAASVIKVFIMRYVYSLKENGELSSDYYIHGQSIEHLIHSMIRRSDNYATNMLIDYFGMESINQYLLEQGFIETILQRRMLDMEARYQGRDNYTSTRDTMEFLKRLYYNRSTFPYSEMLEIMTGQEINNKILLFLPDSVSVANKTGELDDVENDIGIVFLQDSAFAIVVLTRGVTVNEDLRREIGHLAFMAYEYAYSLNSESN